MTVSNAVLAARYLGHRWFADLEDLIAASIAAGELAFDDLELDQDLAEMLRAIPRAELARFVELSLSEAEEEREAREALSEELGGGDEGDVFLVLMAFNIAAFLGEPAAEAAALAHLERGTGWMRDGPAFARLLARSGSAARARGRLRAALPEGELRSALLEACVAQPLELDGWALHFEVERERVERSLGQAARRLGWERCGFEDEGPAARVVSLRRVGRQATLLVEAEEGARALAQALSHEKALGLAWLVSGPAQGAALEVWKGGVLRSQGELAREGFEAAGEEFDPWVETAGWLLSRGARIYDREAPRGVASLRFDAYLGEPETLGTARRWGFRAAPTPEGGGAAKPAQRRRRKGR